MNLIIRNLYPRQHMESALAAAQDTLARLGYYGFDGPFTLTVGSVGENQIWQVTVSRMPPATVPLETRNPEPDSLVAEDRSAAGGNPTGRNPQAS